MTPGRSTADRRWAELLARWAIPDELVAAAPAPPYYFDPAVFIAAADAAVARDADTPSDRVARQALPAGGSVLDVGCGSGAASLRLRPARLVGVDSNRMLLDAFAEHARRLGIEVVPVEGTWPDVAESTPTADVVVCHHVFYNVAGLARFGAALTGHAAHRVVVELTAVHPLTWMSPYWEAVHGLTQPDEPTADDAVAVLVELGLDVGRRDWRRPIQMIGESDAERVARVARRLCLGPERHDELRQLLEAVPPPTERDVVTLWWSAG